MWLLAMNRIRFIPVIHWSESVASAMKSIILIKFSFATFYGCHDKEKKNEHQIL